MKYALIHWAMQTDADAGEPWGHGTPGRVVEETKNWREQGEYLHDAHVGGFSVLFLLFIAAAQP